MTHNFTLFALFQFQVVKTLFRSGVSLHSDTDNFKDSPIYQSTLHGKLHMIKYIVEHDHGILQKKIRGALGNAPNFEYIHVWTDLLKLVKSEQGLIIGKYC